MFASLHDNSPHASRRILFNCLFKIGVMPRLQSGLHLRVRTPMHKDCALAHSHTSTGQQQTSAGTSKPCIAMQAMHLTTDTSRGVMPSPDGVDGTTLARGSPAPLSSAAPSIPCPAPMPPGFKPLNVGAPRELAEPPAGVNTSSAAKDESHINCVVDLKSQFETGTCIECVLFLTYRIMAHTDRGCLQETLDNSTCCCLVLACETLLDTACRLPI